MGESVWAFRGLLLAAGFSTVDLQGAFGHPFSYFSDQTADLLRQPLHGSVGS